MVRPTMVARPFREAAFANARWTRMADGRGRGLRASSPHGWRGLWRDGRSACPRSVSRSAVPCPPMPGLGLPGSLHLRAAPMSLPKNRATALDRVGDFMRATGADHRLSAAVSRVRPGPTNGGGGLCLRATRGMADGKSTGCLADVAKSVDAADLKSASPPGVRVQVPPSAPLFRRRPVRPGSVWPAPLRGVESGLPVKKFSSGKC